MFKSDKESRIKLQTNIDTELHHRFKAACYLQGKGMNTVLTEIITEWMESIESEFLSDKSKVRRVRYREK